MRLPWPPIHSTPAMGEAAIWDRHAVDVVIDVDPTPACASRYLAGAPASVQKVIVALPARVSRGAEFFPVRLRMPGIDSHVGAGDPNLLWYPCPTTHALAPVLGVLLENHQVQAASFASLRALGAGDTTCQRPPRVSRNTQLAAYHVGQAIGKIWPALKDRVRGDDIWIDAPGGSVISLVAQLAGPTTPDKVNDMLLRAARQHWHGIIALDGQIDSSVQVVGRDEAGVVASRATRVIQLPGDRSLVKLHIWYDDVWGYGRQLLRLVQEIGSRLF